MTYATIQARVLRRLIDTPAAVQAEVPQLVNEALKTIQKRHNFKVMEGLVPLVAFEGVRLIYVLTPTTFKAFRGEPWRQDNSGAIWPMTVGANTEGTLLGFDAVETGAPWVLVDNENPGNDGSRQLDVYPLPDGLSDYPDGDYRVYLPIWRYLPALVAAGDTNWFTENAEEYIVDKATAEGFALDWDEQRMAVWETKADVKFKEAVREDKLYRISAVRDLVPTQGGNDPRLRL